MGSPFFGYFLWRDKESDSPAGANSRLRTQANSNARIQRPECPHPPALPKNFSKSDALISLAHKVLGPREEARPCAHANGSAARHPLPFPL